MDMDDGHVYTASFVTESGEQVIKVRKDGVIVHSITPGTMAGISDLSVEGGHVYIAGVSLPSPSISIPKVWKEDGTVVFETTESSQAKASGIDFENNQMYVSGFDNGVVKAWRDGTEILSSDPAVTTWGNVASFDITVDGADVYVAGYKKRNTNLAAIYWKNGTEYFLTDGTKNAELHAIKVKDGHVYAAGYVTKNAFTVATLWKDGNVVFQADGTDPSFLLSMAVID